MAKQKIALAEYGGEFVKDAYLRSDQWPGYKTFKERGTFHSATNNEDFPSKSITQIFKNGPMYYISNGEQAMAAVNLKETGFMKGPQLSVSERETLLSIIKELDEHKVHVASVTEPMDGLLLFYCIELKDNTYRIITPKGLHTLFTNPPPGFEKISQIVKPLNISEQHLYNPTVGPGSGMKKPEAQESSEEEPRIGPGASTRRQTLLGPQKASVYEEESYNYKLSEKLRGYNGKLLLPLEKMGGRSVRLMGVTKLVAKQIAEDSEQESLRYDDSLNYSTGKVEKTPLDFDKPKFQIKLDDTDIVIICPLENVELYVADTCTICPGNPTLTKETGEIKALCEAKYVELKADCESKVAKAAQNGIHLHGVSCTGTKVELLETLCGMQKMDEFIKDHKSQSNSPNLGYLDFNQMKSLCKDMENALGKQTPSQNCNTMQKTELGAVLQKYFNSGLEYMIPQPGCVATKGSIGCGQACVNRSEARIYDLPSKESNFRIIPENTSDFATLLTTNNGFTEVDFRGIRGFVTNDVLYNIHSI